MARETTAEGREMGKCGSGEQQEWWSETEMEGSVIK